ncbi:PREDICTED: myb-binding protein 1A-like protein [Papilio polytes]|uniref:myb-binding protein 1A-like protein n=1 Tax=Papilio polytes TaxID=76194 RepID=UPI000675E04D|nr:PREDICTED: myb-binding protein 1A-like protein [Papilio polytes]
MNEITNTKPLEVTSSLLDAFELLKANKDDVKLNGGVRIISRLMNDEGDKEIQYVLRRVVRSLGANVPDMRTGHFAMLVALLTNFEQISVSQLFELIKKELHANGSSKSEVGDVALGQILVCSAIFRSGRMLKCNEEEQKQILTTLMKASNKKSYLNTAAYILLLDFIYSLDEEQFSSVVWSNIKEDFKKDLKEYNLDSLYFLLVASTKFPKKVKVKKLLSVPEILHEDNLQIICEKLLAGIDFSTVHHPIYKEIGRQIAKTSHLVQFWVTGIDSQLTKHNRNRELVCISMLTTILQNLDENVEVIPELLSANFFKLFMDWFKGLQTASKIRNKRDNEDDNKIMIKKQKELLNALAKSLKSEKVTSKVRVETLKKVLFNPGEINFSEVTGTSIIKSIAADLDSDGVKKIAKLLKNVLMNTSKKLIKEDVERNWYNNERVKAAELLSFLVSHDAVKDDTEFKITNMKLLMCFGFFKIGGDETVAVSSELAGSIKSCFYRCFSSRFSNVDNLVTVLSSLCNFISTILEKEQVRAKIEKQFTTENMECWQMVADICEKIEDVDSKSKVDHVFLILLYQLGLFLFSEPAHVKVASSSIKELKSCYEHYRKVNLKVSKKKQETTDDEPEWIEVLVEVLLSILSVESSVLRSVVQCAFRLLWEYLTPSSIGQIVSVLDPESEANPLTVDSESEDDNNESDNDDNSDNDDDSTAKMNGESEGSDDSGSDGDDNDDDDDDDDDDGDMKVPDQLRMAIQKALGGAAPDTDTESIDADAINEEDGKKLDDALAEAFKQFQQGKNKKSKKDRKDKKALSDFRVRVLDLIDIYLEKDPSMDICLAMITPLTRCLEFCMQDNQLIELENRVRKTIKNLCKIRKFSSTQDVSVDILSDYLKSIIDKGGRSHFMFQALGDIVTFFATFIIHCSLKVKVNTPKKKKLSPILDIFKDALQNYFRNRNCLLPIIFFHNVLQTEWDDTYDLVPIVLENIFNKDVRHFRRNEGIELLSGFYRALNRNKPCSETLLTKLNNIESEFEKQLSTVISLGEEFKVKTNFVTLLKKLINTMKGFHESSRIKTNLNFQNLFNLLSQIKTTGKCENVNNQANKNHQNPQKSGKKKKNKRKQSQNRLSEPPVKKVKADVNATVK